MNQPGNGEANFLSRFSINIKIIVVLVLLTGSTWAVLDFYQGERLKDLFEQQLSEVLQHHAQEARLLFDKHTRSFQNANKVIISQRGFSDYLTGVAREWQHTPPGEVKRYDRRPPWLPATSVLRAMAFSQYYLLFDADEHLREAYSFPPGPLPMELVDFSSLMQRLSHNQALMTDIAGSPFMVASGHFYDADHRLLGTLTLASPLNNDFLYSAMEGLLPDKIVCLVDNLNLKIIATNRPDLIPEGSSMRKIESRFLVTGESFFDYGASDLETHFVSLAPKNEYDALTNQIHTIGQRQRLIMALVMMLPLLATLFWITRRLTRLTKKMTAFSGEYLSGQQNLPLAGDQLHLLEKRFGLLTREIIQTNIESENKYRALIETTRTGFVILDAEGTVLDANREYLRMTGRQCFKDIMGHKVQEWTADYDRERNRREVERCFSSGRVAFSLEIDYMGEDGKALPIDISATVIEQEGEKIILGIVRDITERKEAAEKLKKSLAEKEVLLKEIHHRVKNNMQIISSLLSLQGQRTQSPEAKEVIADSRGRLKSMGLIHEKLYQADNLARINFGDYIRTLTRDIARSYAKPGRNIRLIVNAENIPLPVDIAIPCGLLMNELISNSYKHAFADTCDGEIRLLFKRLGTDEILLVVSDTGKGLPTNFTLDATDTLGINVVTNLARQLEAELDFTSDNGTEWTVRFHHRA